MSGKPKKQNQSKDTTSKAAGEVPAKKSQAPKRATAGQKSTGAKSNATSGAKKASADKKARAEKTAPAAKTTSAKKTSTAGASKSAQTKPESPATKKTGSHAPVHSEASPKRQSAKKTHTDEQPPTAARPSAPDHRSSTAVRQPVGAGMTPQRTMMVAVLVVAAFFGAYNFASAKSQAGAVGYAADAAAVYGQPAGGAGGAAAGGGCCGGGGAPVEAQAVVEGDVQRIAVDTSAGSFNPNVLKVKAGIPVEIDFSQAPGGCLSGVYFPDFDINEDLTSGPKTVKLPAMEPGTYSFYCQMQMVSAQIVVE